MSGLIILIAICLIASRTESHTLLTVIGFGLFAWYVVWCIRNPWQ